MASILVVMASNPRAMASNLIAISNDINGFNVSEEKDSAFDLLDALTRSGALPLSHAEMHIVVAATQIFEKTVMETVIQERNGMTMISVINLDKTDERIWGGLIESDRGLADLL